MIANGEMTFQLHTVAKCSFPSRFFDNIPSFDSDKRPVGDNVPFPCISAPFRSPDKRSLNGRLPGSGDSSPDLWEAEVFMFRRKDPYITPPQFRTFAYEPSPIARLDPCQSDGSSHSTGEYMTATLLELSKPLAACTATGRFIYHVKAVSREIGAAYIVDYL
jgi:hypothetical protein